MEPLSTPEPAPQPERSAEMPQAVLIVGVLWRPWYAKLWWITTLLFWSYAGTAGGLAPQSFYWSGLGIVASAILLPVTALITLGFGYRRRNLANDPASQAWDDPDAGNDRTPGALHSALNEMDPRSGPLWIGYPFRDQDCINPCVSDNAGRHRYCCHPDL